MRVSWELLPPFIALAITFAATQTAVVLTAAIRRRDYRLFEDKGKESLARQFPLETINQSPAEARWKAISPFLNTLHKAANAAQTSYHNAVVRSAGCLAVAFIALVLGTLSQQDWALTSLIFQQVDHVLTWVDAIAILCVLILFLYARIASRRWIKARVGAELLRQYQFLCITFPNASAVPTVDEIKTQFDLEADIVRARVQEGWTTDIISRIEQFWSEHKSFIEKCSQAELVAPGGALQIYMQRRVLRQLGWFADTKSRLEHIGRRRTGILLALYVIAALLAIVKLLFSLRSGHSPAYLFALLLILTGMSATMTAYYINQNARSLIHRYNMQQRRISVWLDTFNERWKIRDLPSLIVDIAAKTEIRASILRFEDLMIEELIDWVHITSHDAIELAP